MHIKQYLQNTLCKTDRQMFISVSILYDYLLFFFRHHVSLDYNQKTWIVGENENLLYNPVYCVWYCRLLWLMCLMKWCQWSHNWSPEYSTAVWKVHHRVREFNIHERDCSGKDDSIEKNGMLYLRYLFDPRR